MYVCKYYKKLGVRDVWRTSGEIPRSEMCEKSDRGGCKNFGSKYVLYGRPPMTMMEAEIKHIIIHTYQRVWKVYNAVVWSACVANSDTLNHM